MGHALTAARRTTDYVRILEREAARLRRQIEALTTSEMAAKTAAASLREEVATLRAQLATRLEVAS